MTLFQTLPDSIIHKSVDTMARVQNITHGKFNVFESYFFHLAKNPERIDSLLMWGGVTLFFWALFLYYKKEMIAGLRMTGKNEAWEGGEQVTFYSILIFPPIIGRVAFFTNSSNTQVIALYIITGLIAYQVFGRYIFDWALAFKGGLSSVPPVKQQEATTVTTETKTTVDSPKVP